MGYRVPGRSRAMRSAQLRGDPGIGSFLRGAVGGIAKVAGAVLPGPAGTVARLAGRALSGPQRPTQQIQQLPVPVIPTPGVRGALQRTFPGGATGYQAMIPLQLGRRRRKINPANAAALRRANARINSFVRLAKSTLKHTHYQITTRGSGRRSTRRAC